jgi:transcriptional regulator
MSHSINQQISSSFQELIEKLSQFLQILTRLSCHIEKFSLEQFYDVIKLAQFIQEKVSSFLFTQEKLVLGSDLFSRWPI